MRAKCVLREKCLRGRIPEANLTAQISRSDYISVVHIGGGLGQENLDFGPLKRAIWHNLRLNLRLCVHDISLR